MTTMEIKYYLCPTCKMKSYNPKDIEHRYCGYCHRFEDQRPEPGLVFDGETWAYRRNACGDPEMDR